MKKCRYFIEEFPVGQLDEKGLERPIMHQHSTEYHFWRIDDDTIFGVGVFHVHKIKELDKHPQISMMSMHDKLPETKMKQKAVKGKNKLVGAPSESHFDKLKKVGVQDGDAAVDIVAKICQQCDIDHFEPDA